MRLGRAFMKILALLVLLHVYIGIRLVPAVPIGVGGVLLLSTVLIPLSWNARAIRQPWSDRVAWAGLLAMGWFSSLLVLTVLRDLILLAAYPFAPPEYGAALNLWSAPAVLGLALFASVAGFRNARRTARIVDVDVPLDHLPEALNGFTIAQISDIHVGPTIKGDYVAAIVEAVNALEADLIAITGDLVDGSVARLAAHVAPLEHLSARHGVYFVTGNHDYYSGERQWTAELRRLGIKVLKNEHAILRHDGAALLIAGVTDYSAHHFDHLQKSDPFKALSGAPRELSPKILLAHQPRSAEAAAQAGFDLQLSGHTHGGQFWPWVHFVRVQQPFTAGLHRLRRLWVYTSRGTGYWGPPKRFGAPSEITRIRLVRTPAAGLRP